MNVEVETILKALPVLLAISFTVFSWVKTNFKVKKSLLTKTIPHLCRLAEERFCTGSKKKNYVFQELKKMLGLRWVDNNASLIERIIDEFIEIATSINSGKEGNE